MKKSHLVTDAEAEKVQHVVEAVDFFTHTCGYQPGCLCTEMYPARIKRLLATRAACEEGFEKIAALTEGLEGLTAQRMMMEGVSPIRLLEQGRDIARALVAELRGEKP